MKKESIILFILCILTTNALAQEYHPFVEEGKVWGVDGYVYEMKGEQFVTDVVSFYATPQVGIVVGVGLGLIDACFGDELIYNNF